jgi:hypothetical protein
MIHYIKWKLKRIGESRPKGRLFPDFFVKFFRKGRDIPTARPASGGIYEMIEEINMS